MYHTPVNCIRKKLRAMVLIISKSVLNSYFQRRMSALHSFLNNVWREMRSCYLLVDKTVELVRSGNKDGWVHLRRLFVEALVSDSAASGVIGMIGGLFDVEYECKACGLEAANRKRVCELNPVLS